MINPKISVVMSVYNQAQYLKQSITSILNQAFVSFELIIINDASTDATLKILRQFKDGRIKLLLNRKHRGLAASLNRGIRHSRGEYIARMDADDIARPDRLKLQLHFLESHPAVVACGTGVDLINTQGQNIGRKTYPQHITKSLLMRYNPLIHPTVMIRKAACIYNENLNGAEDYDLWLRLGSQRQLVNLRQTLLAYRVNPWGISWSQLKQTELQAIKARFKALKDYNYPRRQAIYLIKPILSYLIPSRIKKLLFHIK